MIVPENNHQNAPPSPPLPPPPPSLTIPEFEVVDLPLPPPPSPSSANKSLTEQFGNISQPNSDQQPQQNNFSSHQQSLFCPENDNHLQSISNHKIAESMLSSKSEIATQTTETLRRGSGIMSKEPHSKYSFKSENPMSQPNVHNQVDQPNINNQVGQPNISNQVGQPSVHNQVDGDNKNLNADDFQTPWSYNRLWPKEKNVSNSNIGNGFESCTASPITAATSFISNCAFSSSKLSSSSNEELLNKKVELISRLSTKLEILRNEEEVLNHEIEANSTLGSQIISKLKSLGISDQETQKITLHCDEIEKVTRLLLSLSARLQQIEIEFKEKFKKEISLVNFKLKQQILTKSNNQSVQMESKQNDELQLSPEMKSLLFKQDKLLAQLEEALQLRKSIDKRSQLIADKILKKYFIEKPENVLDFNEFIKLKSKLIVEQREIKDKIHSGEKQLQALKMF